MKTALAGIVLAAFAASAMVREPLWKNGAPGALGTEPKDIPTIDIYAVENGNGAAVVVCPGGGYHGLALNHEGKDIAAWLNSNGVAAVVLEYRMKGRGYENPAPMQDVQRAIQTVRARAVELKIDPKRIGVLGFSAGGHLAGTAATKFTPANPAAEDPIARESNRPDFAVLCYAVLAFDKPGITHFGSQSNLLGKNPSKDLIDSFSIDKQVTKDTPPTFLWHTDEDKGVPSENSILYYMACRQFKVPAELHVYAKGGHGSGLAKRLPGTCGWSDACIAWMKNMGIVPK